MTEDPFQTALVRLRLESVPIRIVCASDYGPSFQWPFGEMKCIIGCRISPNINVGDRFPASDYVIAIAPIYILSDGIERALETRHGALYYAARGLRLDGQSWMSSGGNW